MLGYVGFEEKVEIYYVDSYCFLLLIDSLLSLLLIDDHTTYGRTYAHTQNRPTGQKVRAQQTRAHRRCGEATFMYCVACRFWGHGLYLASSTQSP